MPGSASAPASRERHIAEESQASSDLALRSEPRALCGSRHAAADEIDLIVVATSTPDYVFPSTACLLQAKLGVKGCAAFDVQAVCSGFVYGLATADSFIRSRTMTRRALVVGAEVFSRILDWNDRGTCVLFGDGAGAVVLAAGDKAGNPCERAARRRQPCRHALGAGQRVRRRGGRLAVPADERPGGVQVRGEGARGVRARDAWRRRDMQLADVDWLIPHQANVRILEATARKLGLPREKLVVTVDHHGNTSAASVPLALDEFVRAGKIRRGPPLLLQGVGGGFTWGSTRSVHDYEARDGFSRTGIASGRHAAGLRRPA